MTPSLMSQLSIEPSPVHGIIIIFAISSDRHADRDRPHLLLKTKESCLDSFAFLLLFHNNTNVIFSLQGEGRELLEKTLDWFLIALLIQ